MKRVDVTAIVVTFCVSKLSVTSIEITTYYYAGVELTEEIVKICRLGFGIYGNVSSNDNYWKTIC